MAGAREAAGSGSRRAPARRRAAPRASRSSAATRPDAPGGDVGSIIGCARPAVYSSSPKSTSSASTPAAATSTPASASRVPPTNSPAGACRARAGDAVDRPLGHVVTEAAQHGLGRLGQVGAAGPQQRRHHRRAEPVGVRREGGGHLVGRRLGDQERELDGGVGVEPRERGAGREPSDLGGQVATADAVRRGDTDAGVVEQRQHLLTAGAGGGDDPDRPRSDDVGEPEPDPADDGGAAVGAHHQQIAGGGVLLEGELLLERHVVAEDHHVAAGLERVHGLDRGTDPGHRDQHASPRAGARGRRRVVRVRPPGSARRRRDGCR